jgi:hypothetical protein
MTIKLDMTKARLADSTKPAKPAVPSNSTKLGPPPVTTEYARKRAEFLRAVETFGICSREALHAASAFEYAKSYPERQQ